jgi:hypothetical protein
MSSVPLLTATLKEYQGYWAEKLSREIEDSNLPLNLKRPSIPPKKKEAVAIDLPADLAQRLTAFAKGSSFLIYTTIRGAGPSSSGVRVTGRTGMPPRKATRCPSLMSLRQTSHSASSCKPFANRF